MKTPREPSATSISLSDVAVYAGTSLLHPVIEISQDGTTKQMKSSNPPTKENNLTPSKQYYCHRNVLANNNISHHANVMPTSHFMECVHSSPL